MSLDHTKRMSKKIDADRAWHDYYAGRPTRKARPGAFGKRIIARIERDGRELLLHATKGWRSRAA